jgi:kelch-like protein 10
VYAIGGEDFDGHRLKMAERYDYKTNQWSLIASMNTKRCRASAAALNGNTNPVKQYRVN